MKRNIRKILREYFENPYEKNDFMRKVDFAQKKAIEDSDYPEETKKVKKIKNKIKKRVKKAYKQVTGKEPVSDNNVVVKIDDKIKAGKIASFEHPETKRDIGVMKIHPKALDDINYVKDIIKHELIHAAHGLEDEEARNHGGDFQKIADKVGLPKKYRH